MLDELAAESRNEHWVRGAHAVCELYAAVDAVRFEVIIQRLAADTQRTALAEGARWLLVRWHAVQRAAADETRPRRGN